MSKLEAFVLGSAARLGTSELVVLGVGIVLMVGASLGLIFSLSY
jgi:hypothetical protein